MTMLDYLEQDKEHLLFKLKEAQTPEKADLVVKNEMDTLLLRYNEKCNLPIQREAAAYMLQTARMSSALVNTTGEIRVWEEKNYGTQKSSFGTGPKLLLGISGVSGAASLCLALLSTTHSVTDVLLCILLLCTSVGTAWLSGKGTRVSAEESGSYRTEQNVDSDKIYTCLHNMLYAVDRNLESVEPFLLQEKDGELPEGNGMLTHAEEDLFAGLLEAFYAKDGDYALERLGDVKFYLHRKGIESVDYNGTNREYFDFIPAKQAGTYRPALVCDGTLIRKGMASEGR